MQKELTEYENNLKQHGEKIIVDIDNCEIKENNYYEDSANKKLLPARANPWRSSLQATMAQESPRSGKLAYPIDYRFR